MDLGIKLDSEFWESSAWISIIKQNPVMRLKEGDTE